MLRGPLLCFTLVLFCGVTVYSDRGVCVPLTVPSGDTTTLNCSTSERIHDIRAVTVEWRRTDLEDFVLIFRDGKLLPFLQDSYFKNRVDLANPELTNGDLSINLRNVQNKDSGVYECYFYEDLSRKKRAITEEIPLNSINLEVKEQSPESGSGEDLTETGEGSSLGLTVGLTIMALVLSVTTALVLFVRFYPKFKKQHKQMELIVTSDQSVPLSLQQNKSSVCAPLVSDL